MFQRIEESLRNPNYHFQSNYLENKTIAKKQTGNNNQKCALGNLKVTLLKLN